MLKANDGADYWVDGDFSAVDYSDHLSIDVDSFLAILGENPDPSSDHSLSSPEDLSFKNVTQCDSAPDTVNGDFQTQNGILGSAGKLSERAELSGASDFYPSDHLDPLCSRAAEHLSESWLNNEIFGQGRPETLVQIGSPGQSASLADWISEYDTSSLERVGASENAPPYINVNNGEIHYQIPNYSTNFNFYVGDAYRFSDCVDLTQPKVKSETGFSHGGALHCMMVEQPVLSLGKSGSISGSSGEIIEALEENPCTSPMEICFWDAETSLQSAPDNELDSSQVSDIIYENMDHFSPVPFSFEAKMDADDTSFVDCSRRPDAFSLPFVSSKEKIICVKDEVNECQTETVCSSGDMNLIAVEGRTGKSISNTSLLDYVGINSSHATNLKCENGEFFPPISGRPSDANGPTANGLSSLSVHCTQSMPSSKHLICEEDEREDKVIPTCNLRCPTNVTNEAVRSNNCSPSGLRSLDDDDADVCILEDISDPVHPPLSVIPARPLVVSQRSTFSDPLHQTGVGGMRLKMNDERLTFRVALQDLSQPKSEASPPDGALAVPLLRHQRIALSWMVQKETASLHCSGGILADDQGLGKTISTIALILKERSPSSMAMKQRGLEALNLDEDDSGVLELGEMKQDGNSVNVMVTSSMKSNILAKGRPAAGTLVVCPTSVLRQWAEELRNKVTSKANISVLVYHGSNRTKDPHELAKYDVVLTTYSIVSMEVPKQPLVDKDDDEKGKPESHGLPHAELSSSKKRKYPPSPSKKSKDRKGLDNAFLESVARPLARVGWFRVVLDEAQSIKNHRTQVARACWGLRAKRRWCLSGTPIQNAVDDLYSYFRFLRYDPYAVYKSFCSMIKVPINRNPTNGYKKLQAVLKTIMLRRTKGTFLDGEPIINLPPKSIEMKKVDFSEEERDFYAKLEADSRAQFKVYAAAGTVKQNYVNILLMLLRLRQACDHPLLVKGYDSNSCWRSSLEVAKKLPRERQMGLLNCLEACLAICGICNDPPEDAVVTICGHVFCNQCICEHLTGDDNLCPAAHCKIQLSVTSVFSRTTLKSSLYGQPGQDFSSELSETPKPCLEDPISDSSKIKAALEFLKSLPGSRDHALSSSSLNSHGQLSRCPENSSDFHSGVSSKDVAEKISVVDEGVNGSNKKLVEKAIVFSQWTRMLDLLEARLKMSSIQYRRLDGTMSVAARDKAVKDFNTVPEVTVMIMSLKAASLGLNMVAACHVLLLDLWWNPTTEDQAIDRAHRIGQTRPVTVLRFTVKDTVEDRILALQQKKREMVASAFGEDETGSRQTRLTVDDLKYLFMA